MGLEVMRLFTLLMNEILCFYKLPSTSQNSNDHRSVSMRYCKASLTKEHFVLVDFSFKYMILNPTPSAALQSHNL